MQTVRLEPKAGDTLTVTLKPGDYAVIKVDKK